MSVYLPRSTATVPSVATQPASGWLGVPESRQAETFTAQRPCALRCTRFVTLTRLWQHFPAKDIALNAGCDKQAKCGEHASVGLNR